MPHTVSLIFSNYWYVVLSVLVFATMTTGMLILSEYVFLEPYVVGHIPSGTEIGFTLIMALSVLSSLVIPMNVYRIRTLRTSRRKMGSGILGSLVGTAAGACSCGPIGFAVISTFGSAGATAAAFLTSYEIPVRILAIGILALAYLTTTRSLEIECRLDRAN